MNEDAKDWLQYREPLPTNMAKVILGDDYNPDYEYMMVSEPRGTYITYDRNGEEVVIKLEEDNDVEEHIDKLIVRDSLINMKNKRKSPPLYAALIVVILTMFIVGVVILLRLKGYV